ncbi:MAG: hypothetical protein AB1466_02335 [Actinomycetota bacterium]
MYPGSMITSVEPNRVECGKTVKIKILGAPLGQLNVAVTNPDGQSDTLKGGFTVIEAETPIHEPEVTTTMSKIQKKLGELEEDLEKKKKENAKIVIWIEQWIFWGWLLGFLWWIPWIVQINFFSTAIPRKALLYK